MNHAAAPIIHAELGVGSSSSAVMRSVLTKMSPPNLYELLTFYLRSALAANYEQVRKRGSPPLLRERGQAALSNLFHSQEKTSSLTLAVGQPTFNVPR